MNFPVQLTSSICKQLEISLEKTEEVHFTVALWWKKSAQYGMFSYLVKLLLFGRTEKCLNWNFDLSSPELCDHLVSVVLCESSTFCFKVYLFKNHWVISQQTNFTEMFLTLPCVSYRSFSFLVAYMWTFVYWYCLDHFVYILTLYMTKGFHTNMPIDTETLKL